MTRLLTVVSLAVAVLMLSCAAPVSAFAQVTGLDTPSSADLKTSNANGTYSCSTLPEAKGGVLLGRIVPCVLHTIETTTVTFSRKMVDWLLWDKGSSHPQPLVLAFTAFVVALFGVKILMGEREIGGHAILLLLKIALVVGILEMTPEYIVPSVYSVMEDGVSMVTGTLGSDSSTISCDIDKYGDANTPLVWKQMDCVMGKLYGFSVGNQNMDPKGPKVNMVLAASAAGLLTGFAFGGTLGVAVFFALIGVLWSLFSLILRVVLSFLNGYLIVCVMLLLAPIFMPLVFLRVTSDYFERWWKAILGGILLPIIITAYTMFAFMVYDALLFRPDSLMHNLFNQTLIQKTLGLNHAPCSLNISGDPTFKAAAGNVDQAAMDQLVKNPFLQNFAQPLLSAGSDACGFFKVPKFDISKLGVGDAATAMKKLFRESIELFIMAFLIGAGVNSVENVISSFTGSGLSRVAIMSRADQKIANEVNTMKGSISRAFGGGGGKNIKGSEFVENLPKATKESLGGLLGGIMR